MHETLQVIFFRYTALACDTQIPIEKLQRCQDRKMASHIKDTLERNIYWNALNDVFNSPQIKALHQTASPSLSQVQEVSANFLYGLKSMLSTTVNGYVLEVEWLDV